MALASLLDQGCDEAAVQALWATFPDAAFLRYRPEQLVWQTQGVLAHHRPGHHAVVPPDRGVSRAGGRRRRKDQGRPRPKRGPHARRGATKRPLGGLSG